MNEPVRIEEQPEAPLQITVEQPRADVAVLHLLGDLDLRTAPLLQAALRPLVQRTGGVLVDLRDVGFIGSAGLAELAGAHDAAKSSGAQVVLVASSHAVLRPLEVTGLAALFTIHESVEAALAGL